MLAKLFAKRTFSVQQAKLASLTRPDLSYTVRNQLFINGQW